MVHATPPKRTRRIFAAYEARRDVSEDLVHQTFSEERRVYFGAALDEQAEHAAAAQFVQKSGKRHAAVGCRGQTENFRGSDTTGASGSNKSVGANDPGRVPDPQLRVDNHPNRLTQPIAVDANC